jgi:hypothetical protein
MREEERDCYDRPNLFGSSHDTLGWMIRNTCINKLSSLLVVLAIHG